VTRECFDPDLFEPLAEIEPHSFWFRARNRLVVATLRKHFPTAGSFLEVGCGSGVVLMALREELPHVRLVGCDLYSEGLEIARRRLPDVELVELDARRLPFDAEFDVAGAFDVIEHVDEDEQVLASMYRSVRPGGGVLLLAPQHPWLWSEHDRVVEHRRRYTRGELVGKVRAAGLEVAEISSFVTTLLPGMALSRFADRVRRRPYDPVRDLRPGRLNGVFERILDGERRLIERGVSLPFGGSLLVVARKP
jgi:ubiquinone/menaquinone biosynthesis C-methylase UbiE